MPLGHEPIASELLGDPFVWAAKVEYCTSSFDGPHFGHSTGSSARRTSFSNFDSQLSQRYSKIGMVDSYSNNAIAILSSNWVASEFSAL
jgi:hypothetical protein